MPVSPDQRAMVRGLAALFAAGASLVALTVLLPHGQHEKAAGLLIAAGLAYVVVAALIFGPRALPAPALHGLMALGTLLVAACVLFAGSAGGAYAFMFVWVGGYAAAFFSPRVTAVHLVWAGGLYAAALVIGGHVHPAAVRWLMAMGTSVVAALLISELSRQVRARTRDLSAVAALATQFGGAQDVSSEQVAIAVCEALADSVGAGAVVLFETSPEDGGLHVLGMAGSAHLAPAFDELATVAAADRALRAKAPGPILAPGEGRVRGLVHPVIGESGVAGLLALVWRRPRREVPPRVAEAAALFAGEAAAALARVDRARGERERLALELNDEIVQGLVVAKYALRDGRITMGEQAIDETLDRARALVTGQLDLLHTEDIQPGSLRRRRAS
jgi:hypothetical protein